MYKAIFGLTFCLVFIINMFMDTSNELGFFTLTLLSLTASGIWTLMIFIFTYPVKIVIKLIRSFSRD